jgi:cupin fold WbuC family metalloprotein
MKPEFERVSNFATISRHEVVSAITPDTIEAKIRDAKQNSRKRDILVLHRGNSDPLQRMINAIEPGSYMRPHRHHAPPKAESLVLLRGSLGFVPFLENGTPDRENFVLLHPIRGAIAIDCRESIWHTLVALEPGTVFFEAKSGPFDAATDKEFAPWGPSENAPEAVAYLEGLVSEFRLKIG